MIGEIPQKYEKYDVHPREKLEDDRFSSVYEKILEDFPEDQYLHEFTSELYVVATGNRYVMTRQGALHFFSGLYAAR